MADRALEVLQLKSAVAMRDNFYYLMSMVQPEILYEVPVGTDLNKLANNTPCFGPAKRKLLFTVGHFEKKFKALAATRNTLADLKSHTDLDINALLNLSPGDVIRSNGANPGGSISNSGFKKNNSGVSKRRAKVKK